MPRVVEVCVADVASAVAVRLGGADRIEVCADIPSGGVTPSLGTMTRVIVESGLPTHVLIRPRGGDFVLDAEEIAAASLDIDAARRAGASGVVLGVLTRHATIDRETTALLIERARPMSVTFHRAFDGLADPIAGLDALIRLGVDRVLTSGGPGPARANLDALRALVDHAAGRIVVMAGGGIAESDLPGLLDASGVREVHLHSGVTGPAPTPGPFGARPAAVEAERVRRVVGLVRG